MTTIVQKGHSQTIVQKSTGNVVQLQRSAMVLRQPADQPIVATERDGNVVVKERTSNTLQLQQGPRGLPGPQGAPGPAGGTSFQGTAAVPLGGHRVVRGARDALTYASAADPTHGDDVQGVTLHAAGAGELVNVQGGDEVVEPSWNWIPQEPVYLGLDGLLTQDAPAPPTAAFVLTIGFASSADSLVVRIEPPIYFED